MGNTSSNFAGSLSQAVGNRWSRRSFVTAMGAAAAACTLGGCSSMNGPAVNLSKAGIQKCTFGTLPNGAKIDQYVVTNGNGMMLSMITFGARWTRLVTPDKKGTPGDIILGFNELNPYLHHKTDPYFGATIGRYANRIGKGRFTLDGKTYQIPVNDHGNALHGGPHAYDEQVWMAEEVEEWGNYGVRFRYYSPDMQNGFPGLVLNTVTYMLNKDNTIHARYRANTTKPTIINLTNHAYYNLNGPGKKVLDHVLEVNADHYTPVDKLMIPTGEIASVVGTPLDFRKPTAVGARLQHFSGKGDPHALPFGYDYNWCLNGPMGKMSLCSRCTAPATGRVLEVYTTQPGVQVYTGNFLDGSIKGIGGTYPYHGAITFETQHYPDAPNHANFPSTVLRPGSMYHEKACFKFSTV